MRVDLAAWLMDGAAEIRPGSPSGPPRPRDWTDGRGTRHVRFSAEDYGGDGVEALRAFLRSQK